MVFSSPTQPQTSGSKGQNSLTESLDGRAKDIMHQSVCPEVPFKGQEPLHTSPPAPKRNGHSHHDISQRSASSLDTSNELMLLERPQSLFRSLDLEKGYEYGPAVQFAPGFFTKIPGTQAPDHQQHNSENSIPSRPSRELHSSRPQLASLGGGLAENAPNTEFRPLHPSDRSQTQPLTTDHGVTKNSNDKPDGAAAARNFSRTTGSPPFPDASPRKPSPSTQARSSHTEDQSVTVLGKMETKALASISASTNRVALNPEPDTSPHTAKSEHHTTEKERDCGRHHHSLPQIKSFQHFARESTDRDRDRMVNRPVRDTEYARPARPVYRARPESRSSNVSKPRSRCDSLASGSVVRQRRVNISHEFTTGIAGAINQFTQQQSAALEEQKLKYHKYIKRLKRDLADESGVIAQQISQLDAQTNEIKLLQDSKKQMANELENTEAELRASEDRAQRLEEKYRACKTHLNSAIQEQQDLYTRSKKQWEEAIEQLRAMEKSQNIETEMVVRKAEVIREQMMERVRQAIAQNKSEALQLYGRIEALTQQVEEKERELSHERESVRVLSEKLQNLQATSSGFETLAVQGKEILEKLGEQQARAEEEHQKSAEELRNRLDAMARRLETLLHLMSGQPDVLTSIRQTQDESLRSVTSKLDDILESRNAARETTSQFSTDLELHMRKIWQRLDNQLESLSKQLAEKAEENGMVSTLYRRKEVECEGHMKQITVLRETTEKQADQIQELETNLVALDAAQDESEDTIRRLEASNTETAQLRKDLESKVAAIAELQGKLDAKERTHVAELQSYNANVQKLAQSVQERDEASKVAVQQAAETARREVRIELEKANAKTEESLQEMQHQRDAVAGQLEKFKQKVHEQVQSEAQDAATIRSLQERLAAEEAKGKVGAEQLAQRLTSLEQLESRLKFRSENLETELKAAKDRAVEMECESQRERARFDALVTGLKQWAHQRHAINDLSFLDDTSKSAEEIGAQLARIWGNTSLSQESQTVTPETHPQGLLCDENVKFFVSGLLPQENAKSCTETSQPIKNDAGTGLDESTEPEGNNAEGVLDHDPLPYVSTLHHMRRVIVRSPANVPNSPDAPSVDQEKTRRREAIQPKSIMKRVTRSASNALKRGESDASAGYGAFKRSKQDEVLIESSILGGLGDKSLDTVQAPNSRPDEDNPRRPGKRQRSDTPKPNRPIDEFENAKQKMKREPSKTEKSEMKPGVPIIASQKVFGSGRQEQPPNINNIPQPTARNTRRNRGVGSRDLYRAASVNGSQALGSRQLNVRTYGSQRAAKEPSNGGRDTDSQFALRSQPQSQSRYWTRPKEESQESMTFSQGVGADENLSLPF